MTDENGSASKEHEGDTAKPKYYTPDDISLHNCAEDCWLSLFGQVREISPVPTCNTHGTHGSGGEAAWRVQRTHTATLHYELIYATHPCTR